MTKGLPDPPVRATTASSSFSTCECSHHLLLSNDHGLDSAKAVVEALLDGVERQQLVGRKTVPGV